MIKLFFVSTGIYNTYANNTHKLKVKRCIMVEKNLKYIKIKKP